MMLPQDEISDGNDKEFTVRLDKEEIRLEDKLSTIEAEVQNNFIEYLSYINIQKSLFDAFISILAVFIAIFFIYRQWIGQASAENLAIAIIATISGLSFALISIGEFQLSARGRRFTRMMKSEI